ncbi:DUF1949 domain-containing protein [Coriobacteriales bacterium OH1046]|nr:DUF1949 domain-containing protein [Coriobacteriales bacterium OH1046]
MATGEDSYRTLVQGFETLGAFEDRRSRFVASVRHVANAAEAEAHLAEIRALHHDARHHVPALILAGGIERCSDDGEPQRTAGLPVLEVLRGAGLADVSCVVTRYFGGTLLGPGGLARAYTAAAQKAITAAERDGTIIEMRLVTPVVVQIPYAAYDRVVRMVAEGGGKVKDSLFAEDVQLACAFPTGDESPFMEALRELASGEELARAGDPRFAAF